MKIPHRMKIALVTTSSCALVLAGAASGGPSAAADTVNVADTFKDCMAKANTTFAMGECIIAERRRLDAEMNKVIQQLVKNLNPSEKALLVRAQQRWIAYRDDECDFAAGRFAGGSIASVVGSSCKIDLTVERLTILRKHLAGPPP
jgi:uncharacterized protein YecT (DUF1311 family)